MTSQAPPRRPRQRRRTAPEMLDALPSATGVYTVAPEEVRPPYGLSRRQLAACAALAHEIATDQAQAAMERGDREGFQLWCAEVAGAGRTAEGLRA